MRSVQLAEALTASEPISTTLEDGSIVEGTLGFHPSGKGRFKVSYAGKSIMGMRSYIGVEYMRPGAMILLRQMADAGRVQGAASQAGEEQKQPKKEKSLSRTRIAGLGICRAGATNL